MTATYAGARATYLKYELKNVSVLSFQTNAEGSDEMAPVVILANNSEELKVVYTGMTKRVPAWVMWRQDISVKNEAFS